MKKQFFIANWKSHQNVKETKEWFDTFLMHASDIQQDSEIILCPPFPLLSLCHELIHMRHLPIALGSQTISSFPEGSYTGEVSGKVLKDFVTYTLIGHSERRRFLHETDEMIASQVQLALASNITPILLVGKKDAIIPKGVSFVIYEPPSAISTSSGMHAEDPEEVEAIASFLKHENGVLYVLYGGSVSPENIQDYTRLPSIHGVIVGKESLDPQAFSKIIQHA